ncbi:MAG: eukaryotic-like serine/threonine-protein kinase, partial [Acidobacteriaceae bacterium]|nr:eukaryotic-like serine/threonine-protein kinase [Acidobacteriaceae bacterium]
MTEIEIWTKWESQMVNGLFPLRRFLGRSNHSVVFLTEYKTQNSAKAAIKLVPVDPALADLQLSNWKRIAALSHPHLIRTLDSGRCKLGGHPFLFVVMEYAEQTLAQILPHRALTPDEVREMLNPTLGALAYLHRNRLVQGQLKPPNFLVVNDQLKLASDTIRAFGDPAPSVAKPSVYDPPEARNGAIDGAGDVWGLGISLVEALTQTPPALDDKSVVLPATLPPAFLSTVRRCLSPSPGDRPTIFDLEAQFSRAPQAPAPLAQPAVLKELASVEGPTSSVKGPTSVKEPDPVKEPVSVREPAVFKAAIHTTAAQNSSQAQRNTSRTHLLGPAIAVSIIVLVAIWAAMRPFRPHPNSVAPASSTVQTAPQPPPSQPAGSQNPSNSMAATSVLHQETPVLSHSTRNSIRGQ